jgi:hypothetical protein
LNHKDHQRHQETAIFLVALVLLVVDLSLIATPALAYTVPAIEPIYGVTVGPQGVTVRLASHGCTTKADLTVAVAKNPPRPLVLFARKRPDACNAPATPVDVVYTFEELGLEPGQAFSLANPLGGGR